MRDATTRRREDATTRRRDDARPTDRPTATNDDDDVTSLVLECIEMRPIDIKL